MYKKLIVFGVILGLMLPQVVVPMAFELALTPTAVAQDKGEKRLTKKEVRGVEIKEIKKKQMTQAQLEQLLDRVDSARNTQAGNKVKQLKQKFKQDRVNLQQNWKDKLKDQNLSVNEKETLKTELKAQKNSLKALNEELKRDLSKSLAKNITPQELNSIEFVEPNYVYEPQSFSDPQYINQWGLQSIGMNGIPGIDTDSQEKIIVAVVDSGVNFTHPDLTATVWTSATCVDENNVPIPGGCLNGGYDFVDEDNDPFPSDNINHGSSVASIIGAETNNNEGMASVGNNDIEIMSVRACCTAEGFFEVEDIDQAFRFAVNNGAQVINASFGGPTDSIVLQNAVAYARDNGVLVVTSAGNYGTNNDVSPLYPANYNQQFNNVLSVAATTSWDHLAYFSNWGETTVDLGAPGQEVIAAQPTHYYTPQSGTSFSAPLVSGVVAQMLRGSDLSYQGVKNLLLDTVQQLPALSGQVSQARGLRFTEPEPPTDPVDPDPTDPTEPEEPPTEPEDPITDEEEEEIDEDLTEEEEAEVANNCADLPKKEKRACEKEEKLAQFCAKPKNANKPKCNSEEDEPVAETPAGSGESSQAILPNSVVGDLIFHHEDHLTGGSIDTDGAGTVVQLLDYFPFGDTRIDDHSVDYQNDYQFTGKERDEETSLLYYEARYYDSSIGRFTSQDAWDGDLSDPQSFNKFSYVRNNPVKYNDPSGNVFVFALAIPAVAEVISLGLATLAIGISLDNQINHTGNVSPFSFGNSNIVSTPADTSSSTGVMTTPVTVPTKVGKTGFQGVLGGATVLDNPGVDAVGIGDAVYNMSGNKNIPRSSLPRGRNNEYLPDPAANGSAHTVLGSRIGRNGETYTQGAQFGDGNVFQGRHDRTDHGRPQDHANGHFHRAKGPDRVEKGDKKSSN